MKKIVQSTTGYEYIIKYELYNYYEMSCRLIGKSPIFEIGLCMFESCRLSYSFGSLKVKPYNVTIRVVSSSLMQSVNKFK